MSTVGNVMAAVYLFIWVISDASDWNKFDLNEFSFGFVQICRCLLAVHVKLVGHPCEMWPRAKRCPPVPVRPRSKQAISVGTFSITRFGKDQ